MLVIPLPGLPAALSDDPEAALRQMAEQAAAALEQLRHEQPETYARLEPSAYQFFEGARLFQTMQEFLQAETWAESQRILEQHPELLEERAEALLERLIRAARIHGHENAAKLLDEHRAILRRCREIGILRAFAEKMRSPEGWPAPKWPD
ncbi:MAG: hypothetical protein NZM18_04320 [Thermoflexales bacterium]|nr:hypothetical protein [Thermoflexales bacterium]